VVSQEKAAEIAGLNRKAFLTVLARNEMDVFAVDFDDLKRELDRGWHGCACRPPPLSTEQSAAQQVGGRFERTD
jgi:hypothetical protein